MLKMLDGPQYAYWYNKARELDGDSPVFTDEQVQKMLDGVDGWGNTNWYKKAFGTGHSTQYNVSASGGGKAIRYFASVGSLNQEGNLKGFDYNRINLRSNIDATIANNLTLSLDISGRMEKNHVPGWSAAPGAWNNLPQQALRALPIYT